jgi:putative peptidoglycan lipid II flippase
MLILSILTVVYYFLVPIITPLIFSGFKGEKLELAIRYSRLFSPAIILMGLSLIFSSFYHSFREFVIPSIAGFIFPLSSLISIWFLPSSWGIERLVYGNLVGSAIGLLLMIFLIKQRVVWKWNWDIGNPLIRMTLLLSWPVFMESIFLKIVPFVQKNIASGLPIQGAITLIELSLFIISSIVIFISGPISTSIFPLMGQQNIEEDKARVFQTFIRSINIIFFLAIPFNILLLFESREIVSLVFGYGKFSETDCLITSKLIMITSFAILPNCFVGLAGRMFFVFHETKLVSFCNIALIILSCPFYYIMSGIAGIYGLMGTFTVMTVINATAVFLILRFKHNGISFREFYLFLAKIILCVLIMIISILAFKFYSKDMNIPIILRFISMSTVGLISYLVSCYFFGIDEFKYITRRVPLFGGIVSKDI